MDIVSAMDKRHILDEIRRTATENGGTPLGRGAFFRETGIKPNDWYGRYWARWGDALQEAGFSPNEMQAALPEEELIRKYISMIQELGHFPSEGEVRLKDRSDPAFPSHSTFARLGPKRDLATKIIRYCERVGGLESVVALCRERAQPVEDQRQTTRVPSSADDVGFVYLMRSGRYYKIGKTNAVGRREHELAIQLPDKATTVHVIRTDDPSGIESYWHRRFEAKEWRVVRTRRNGRGCVQATQIHVITHKA